MKKCIFILVILITGCATNKVDNIGSNIVGKWCEYISKNEIGSECKGYTEYNLDKTYFAYGVSPEDGERWESRGTYSIDNNLCIYPEKRVIYNLKTGEGYDPILWWPLDSYCDEIISYNIDTIIFISTHSKNEGLFVREK